MAQRPQSGDMGKDVQGQRKYLFGMGAGQGGRQSPSQAFPAGEESSSEIDHELGR